MGSKQIKGVKGTPDSKSVDCGIKSVSVSCSSVADYMGRKNYRTVYGAEELQELYVDLELINKRFGEQSWKADVVIRLYWFDGQKAVPIAEKQGNMTVEKEEGEVRFGEVFSGSDFSGFTFKEGIYRILVQVNGVGGQSEDIYVMEGKGEPAGYFRVVHTGIDKCCDETEEQSNARPHSYRVLDRSSLKDIRFYFLAQNLLKHEWVYEFVLRVLDGTGNVKVERIVKSGQYIKDPAGNSLLCFAVDLGGEIQDFWQAGGYSLIVIGFGQLILKLDFEIADREEPYQYDTENSGVTAAHKGKEEESTGYSAKGKEEVLERLYSLVGLRKVKEEITHISEYAEFVRLRRENGFLDVFPPLHMIFTGHPGTGKNTVAEIIGELFRQLGLLSSGNVHRCSRKDLVQDGAAAEGQLVRRALADSTGGVLFIEDAGALFNPGDPNDRGIPALGVLVNMLVQEKPEVLVILADDTDEMTEMLNSIPDLKKVFSRQLCFEDYTPEELMEITRNKLEKLQFRFTAAAEDKFFKMLKRISIAREFDFTNGRFIDERLEDAAMRMSKRLMGNRKEAYQKEDLMLITDEDIVTEPETDPGKSLEKLNSMVGLGELKQSILQHLNYIYFIRERQRQGFTDVMPPLNMIFSGNPGTGKLTVAKMMGEIYHSLGILAHPNIVVQNAYNLTGDSGMTPEQMVSVLADNADGGILYIENADVLPQSPFGLSFFEMLLSSISTEEVGDMVVILAGYADNIEKMLAANPTLKTYFPYQFRFNDYKPEELLKIAEDKLEDKKYTFHPKAKEVFEELIKKAFEKRDKHFGNVLMVEKMVNMAIRNMSERTMKIRGERELTRKELTTIMAVDVPANVFDTPKLDKDLFDEEEITGALSELDGMVGQAKIKKQIRDFVELARHYSQQDVKLSTRMSLQWCFTGNSAMGKGTVARIIGRLYKAMGIVDKGHVLDFKVEKLIGQMEDEAQRNIGEALAKSNGGIFLFDEDSPKLNEATGFRERVRAILMNQMAERPGSYIIIYAEPKASVPGFNGNAEHMSDIVNVLVFEDYTKEELMAVLKRRLAKENMKMTDSVRRYMSDFISSLVATEERRHSSSRLMRIVADLMVRNCIQRIAKNGTVEKAGTEISVQKQDVQVFTEAFVADLMKERKKIGYKL